jgi:hypothetical protein
MADEQTCEVGLTLAPLAIGPYSDKYKNFSTIIVCKMSNNNTAAA